jgi:hypothetical protein
MKLSDIMRDIADLIDQKMDQPSGGADLSGNTTQNRLEPIEVEKPVDQEQQVMVPPLQAKLEILKKSENLPNVYNDQRDEIHLMKMRAGLTPCQQAASEDNDITG